MELEITRNDFERALPVGAACTSEVFDSVYPYIEDCVERYAEKCLGEKGEAAIGTDSRLKGIFVRFCCVSGFLEVFRQLDLVLTPTGFGIVSNKDTSPASSMRVDNLEKQLQLRLCKLRGELVWKLRHVSDWGESDQAKSVVKVLFNEAEFFEGKSLATAGEWEQQRISIRYWDGVIRSKISDEMMEKLLCDYRQFTYSLVTDYLIDSFRFYVDGKDDLAKEHLRKAINHMEKNEAEYETYINSQAYETNHYEHFKNTKEATAFIFQG